MPVHSTTTGTYSLADAIFDYENFGIYDGDCGDFVLLVDFDVIRSVTTWPDREIRHVRYEGHFYNASDTSKSIVRNGKFTLTFRFDATGGLLDLTSTGLYEYVEVEGHQLPTIAGRSMTDFAFDPPTSGPRRTHRRQRPRSSATLFAETERRSARAGRRSPFRHVRPERVLGRCHRFD